MDIEEYKLRHNIKELPIMFYFQGAFFWVFPVAVVIGLLCRIFNINFWIGFIILIPYCLFWGYKAFKKYNKNKGKYKVKK